jgi:hypothetical protein
MNKKQKVQKIEELTKVIMDAIDTDEMSTIILDGLRELKVKSVLCQDLNSLDIIMKEIKIAVGKSIYFQSIKYE